MSKEVDKCIPLYLFAISIAYFRSNTTHYHVYNSVIVFTNTNKRQ